MLEPDRDVLSHFKVLYPHLTDEEVETAHDNLRRYVQIALELTRSRPPLAIPLTMSFPGGTVSEGPVDPVHSKPTLG